jgi:protein-S-isoprenylcysteine O-methyltransferase Ste14
LNYITFWTVWIKTPDKNNNFLSFYKKIFPIIWIITINTIPIINSSFLEPYFNENISYLRQYWIWFLLLGVIFFVLGIRIYSLQKRILKHQQGENKEIKLVTNGVYKIVRHPGSLAWLLIFFGSTFILDSFMSLILIPLLVILTELNSFLKEKYVFVPKYSEAYENYKRKTPYMLISPPYNYLLFIIAIFVIYIGFTNFQNIF